MKSTRHHNLFLDGAACFWTSAIVEHIPVLRSPTAARALLAIWDEYRKRYNVRVLGYVIMPDHIHLLVWSEHKEDVERFLEQTLSAASGRIAGMTERASYRGDSIACAWLARFKARATGKSIVRVWKERGRAFPVTEPDALRQKLDYMHANPVRKGLVPRPEDWEFSSAAWYANGSGPFRIDSLDQ